VGVVEEERPAALVSAIVDVLVGLPGHQMVHHVVFWGFGRDVETMGVEVRDVPMVSEEIRLHALRQLIDQADHQGLAALDPDGRPWEEAVVGHQRRLGAGDVHLGLFDLQLDLDRPGRRAEVLGFLGVLEWTAHRWIDDPLCRRSGPKEH